MARAGRILIMPKGNYDANTEYEMLDLVFNGGASWVAKKNVKGIEPTDDTSEHWMKMCESMDLTEIIQRIAALESQMLGTISLDDIDLSGYATKEDLSTVNLNLDALDGRLDAVEPKVTTLTSDVNMAKNNISNLQNLVSEMSGGLKISSGSYQGNGTFGADNKNSIAFDFVPKIVFITPNDEATYDGTITWIHNTTKSTLNATSSNNGITVTFSLTGNTLSWYQSNGAGYQLNTSGKTYNWVALG